MVKADEIILLTDSTEKKWIGKSIYYFKDYKSELSFEQITSPEYNDQFIKSTQQSPNFGNIELTIWNKFTVVNHSTKDWMLSELVYSLDTIEFYYKDASGVYRKTNSGRSQPFSQRKYKSLHYSFDLPVLPNDTATFYLKVHTYKFEYPLIVSTKERFIEHIYYNNIIKGIYLGFVLLIIIYNIILYFTLKDRSYLYYILYLVFVALMMAEISGVMAAVLRGNLHNIWHLGPTIIALNGIFFYLFTASFIETKKQTPKVHNLIKYLFIPLYLFVIVMNLTRNDLIASVLNQTLGLVAILSMYATAVYVYRKGFKPARFYILACTVYFLGVIIYILKTFALIPYNYFTDNAMELGSALEMVMFSVSLSDRITIFRRERAKAKKELLESLQENEQLILNQNKMLETKVEERTKQLEEQNIVISREKEKSDTLLQNILPYETAEELKTEGKAKAKHFESVTIMFTDFKDFTKISEKLSPEDLVTEIDYCFKGFDTIISKYDIEKIKTIGDSYMAAAGLPVANTTHANDIVAVALEFQQFITQYNEERQTRNLPILEMRIGINTGPVIAGIVGSIKFAYDIWGDSVNLASRMESSGIPGKVNISGNTYELIKERYHCEHRGKMEVKSKGLVDMYLVNNPVS